MVARTPYVAVPRSWPTGELEQPGLGPYAQAPRMARSAVPRVVWTMGGRRSAGARSFSLGLEGHGHDPQAPAAAVGERPDDRLAFREAEQSGPHRCENGHFSSLNVGVLREDDRHLRCRAAGDVLEHHA